MDIENKSFNFLGDSITEGCGASGESKVYLNRMKEKYHLRKANNYGIAGTRISRQKDAPEEFKDGSFCQRAAEMDPDADVVVVFGGTNDFGEGNIPLGSFEHRTPETFYGACHYLMDSLINQYPHSTIVFLTPLHRHDEESLNRDGKEKDIVPLSAYVDVIKEVARYYSLPVLDLFATSGMQPRVPVVGSLYCPDGIHPNDAGHEIIAGRLAGFLFSL